MRRHINEKIPVKHLHTKKNVDDVTSPFEGTWRKPITVRCSEPSTHNVNVHYYSQL